MENFIRGLLYAHKDELLHLGNGTPGERNRKQELVTRIDELEAILKNDKPFILRLEESK